MNECKRNRRRHLARPGQIVANPCPYLLAGPTDAGLIVHGTQQKCLMRATRGLRYNGVSSGVI